MLPKTDISQIDALMHFRYSSLEEFNPRSAHWAVASNYGKRSVAPRQLVRLEVADGFRDRSCGRPESGPQRRGRARLRQRGRQPRSTWAAGGEHKPSASGTTEATLQRQPAALGWGGHVVRPADHYPAGNRLSDAAAHAAHERQRARHPQRRPARTATGARSPALFQ